jgi:probable HAF family extracellular repeat protein
MDLDQGGSTMRRIRFRTLIALGALVASLAFLTSDVGPAGATQTRSLYQVIELGSLGGTSSAGNSINNVGWIAGSSNLSGDETTRAALWRDGTPLDLGTLGGANSAVLWPVKNNTGMVAGVAETDQVDPLGESWSCSFFFPTATGHICLGFVWKDGVMRPLPTLGGNNGFATGANNRGHVVGWAENTVHDPTCNPPQVLQFRAVRWDTRHGDRVQELAPLPGDTTSAATATNDRGQVVGISGICADAVGGFSAAHAVLWEGGRPADLGSLGGVAWNTPMAINQRGEVVGFANLPGGDPGAFNAHAFLWTEEEGMQDLGTLPGDALSQGLGINDLGQVAGMSCAAGFRSCRAFLWEDGVMTDLNDLVPGYAGHLVFANDINDAGEITGQAIDAETGDAVAFRATPLGRNP